MDLRPEQLPGALERNVPDLVWIGGDETLLVQDCVEQVRQSLRSNGVSERHRFDLVPGFDWQAFAQACVESSLFASRSLIELHMPEPKPGQKGAEVLKRLAARAPGGNPLLIVTGKVARDTRNSAWAKSFLKAGWLVTIWPVKRTELPGWIRRQLQQRGLGSDAEAVQMLADHTEGNLLAAHQEIEKLALLHPDGRLSAEQLRALLADQSRFSVFELADAALAGSASRTVHRLQVLREEGVETTRVLWSLAREIRTLHALRSGMARGDSLERAMQEEGVWKNRKQLVTGALKRLQLHQLDDLLLQAAATDRAIKGMSPDNPWRLLEQLALTLSGQPTRLREAG